MCIKCWREQQGSAVDGTQLSFFSLLPALCEIYQDTGQPSENYACVCTAWPRRRTGVQLGDTCRVLWAEIWTDTELFFPQLTLQMSSDTSVNTPPRGKPLRHVQSARTCMHNFIWDHKTQIRTPILWWLCLLRCFYMLRNFRHKYLLYLMYAAAQPLRVGFISVCINKISEMGKNKILLNDTSQHEMFGFVLLGCLSFPEDNQVKATR